jgi:flagellar L-ring protein precursor FlgH
MRIKWIVWAILCALLAPAANALKKSDSATFSAKATPPEDALRNCMTRVRAQQAAEVRTSGSLWNPNGQLVRLGTDVKAYRLHDVVSIVAS